MWKSALVVLLEKVMGKRIIEADGEYASIQAASLVRMFGDLGVLEQLPTAERESLEASAAVAPRCV